MNTFIDFMAYFAAAYYVIAFWCKAAFLALWALSEGAARLWSVLSAHCPVCWARRHL
jgi:hypothetical protein